MWVGKKIKQNNVTMKLNMKHKRSIVYNGWVYEKVCLDELLIIPQMLIANFLIHIVSTSTVYLVEN